MTPRPPAFLRLALACLALAACLPALGQTAGDYTIQQKAASGPNALRYWAGTASRLWGTDASGLPTPIAAGTGLSLSGNVLSSTVLGDVVGPASSTNNALAVFDGLTGKLLKNSTAIFNAGALSGITSLSTLDTLDFDNALGTAPAYLGGRVFYDDTDDSLAYYPNTTSSSTMNLGREMWARVRNSTGSTITDGTAVYVNGATGQLATVAKAQADALATSQMIGVATHDLANNSNGFVTAFGEIKGLDTSAYTDGAVLYLSPTTPGAYTTTKPTAPNIAVRVGVVEHAHITQGKILVHPEVESVSASDIFDSTAGARALLTGLDASTGILAQTGATTFAKRTITGTSNEVTVANGDGVAAAPTISLPLTLDLGGKTSLEIPNSATPTVDADGEIAVDTTVTNYSHGMLKYYSGEEVSVIAMPTANLASPTNGYVVAYNSTNDEFELVAAGSGTGTIGGSTGSTDNAILRADGSGGSTIQASPATMTDAGAPSFFDTITLNKTGQTEAGGLEVADDPNSPGTRALFVLPPAVGGRIYMGKTGQAPYSIHFDGAAALESVPEAEFDTGLQVGGVESHSIDRNSEVIKYNSTATGGGGHWFYANGSAYDNTYVAANLVSRIGNLGAKSIEVYEAYTDDSNYERLTISAASGTNVIKPEAAGTGTASKLDIYLTSGVFITSGTGSPEAAVTAPVGSLYSRTDGGANTTLYRKESGTGNTGWVAVSNTAGGGIADGDTLAIGLTFPNTGLHLLDTNASHDLILAPGSDLTADHTLTITTGDADRTLTMTGDASIAGTNTGDVSLAGTPDYITISGQTITRGQIDLATDVTGQLPLANGGTAANLTDPGGDRILFWDDSAGAVTWLTAGTGLTITDTTITASGGSGGKVVAIQHVTSNARQTSTSTTFADITSLSITHTPASSSNKVMLIASINGASAGTSANLGIRFLRDATAVGIGDNEASNRTAVGQAIMSPGSDSAGSLTHVFVDEPATTSSTTWKVQFAALQTSGSVFINRTANDSNNVFSPRGLCTFTLIEFAP